MIIGKFTSVNNQKEFTPIMGTIDIIDGQVDVDIYDSGDLRKWDASLKGDIVTIELWYGTIISHVKYDLRKIGRFPHKFHVEIPVESYII